MILELYNLTVIDYDTAEERMISPYPLTPEQADRDFHHFYKAIRGYMRPVPLPLNWKWIG